MGGSFQLAVLLVYSAEAMATASTVMEPALTWRVKESNRWESIDCWTWMAHERAGLA